MNKVRFVSRCNLCGSISPNKYKAAQHFKNVHLHNYWIVGTQMKCKVENCNCKEIYTEENRFLAHLREDLFTGKEFENFSIKFFW